MTFDISSLAFEPTATVQLKHPGTGELLFTEVKDPSTGEVVQSPVSVKVYGKASMAYRNAETAAMNRALARQARKGKLDAETLKADANDLLSACVVGFENFSLGGIEQTTKSQFVNILSNPQYEWLRTQIDAAVNDEQNFLAH